MRYLDVQAFTPPGALPERWAKILKWVHGTDVKPILPNERLSILRTLAETEPDGPVTVLTTRHAFLFWRRAHLAVEIHDENGRKLPKTMRTEDTDHWAAALALGKWQKGETARLLKKDPDNAELKRWLSLWSVTTATKTSHLETDGKYTVVLFDQIPILLNEINRHMNNGGWVAWDLETNQTEEEDLDAPNPYTAEIVGLSISLNAGEAYYLPVKSPSTDTNIPRDIVTDLIATMYQLSTITGSHFLVHNAKYDLSVLCNPIHKVPEDFVYAIMLPVTHDTMLLAAVTNLPAALKTLAPQLLGVKPLEYKRVTGGKPFSEVPLETAAVYAGQDADWLLRLWPLLKVRAHELEVWNVYQEYERPITEYFMRMERRGLHLDLERLQEIETEVHRKMQHSETLFRTLVSQAGVKIPEDFSISSPAQVAALFYAKKPEGLGLPIYQKSAKTGEASTAEKPLNKMLSEGTAHPAVRVLLAWREADQLRKMFIQPLRQRLNEDGRIRASFKQLGAQATGRTSCSDPNLQQVPKVIRKAFVAEGEFAAIDYSQIELRVMAAEFDEPKMLETFNLPPKLESGEDNPEADIHGRTQREVGLPTRTLAKNFNFGKAFGAGAPTLAETGRIPLWRAEDFSRAFDEAYQAYSTHLKERQKTDNERGWVQTWVGSKRLLDKPQFERQRHENNRFVANVPCQGGAAYIIKWAMRELLPYLRTAQTMGIYPVNMIHDELVFECSTHTPLDQWESFLAHVRRVMEACNPYKEKLPLYTDLERGYVWGEMKEQK